MKLCLHVNGYLFKEFVLPEEIFSEDESLSKEQNIDARREKVCDFVKWMEAKYFRQLLVVRSWQMYLMAESSLKEEEEKTA